MREPYHIKEERVLHKVGVALGILDDDGVLGVAAALKPHAGRCHRRQLELLHVAHAPAQDLSGYMWT